MFRFVAEQPSRSNEADHLETCGGQHFASVFHPLPRRLVVQIVKLPLAGRVVLGDQLVPPIRPFLRFAQMKESVQDDLVSGRLFFAQPREETGILVDVGFPVMVGHDQQRGHRHPGGGQIGQHKIRCLPGQRTDIVNRDSERTAPIHLIFPRGMLKFILSNPHP